MAKLTSIASKILSRVHPPPPPQSLLLKKHLTVMTEQAPKDASSPSSLEVIKACLSFCACYSPSLQVFPRPISPL